MKGCGNQWVIVPLVGAFSVLLDYLCGWKCVKFFLGEPSAPIQTAMHESTQSTESPGFFSSNVGKITTVVCAVASVLGIWKVRSYFSNNDSTQESTEEDARRPTKSRTKTKKSRQPVKTLEEMISFWLLKITIPTIVVLVLVIRIYILCSNGENVHVDPEPEDLV